MAAPNPPHAERVGPRPGRQDSDSRLRLRNGLQKAFEFSPVDHGLLELVLGVENRVCLVAVFVEPGPGHLLFPAPGNADGAAWSVTADEDVVSAPTVRSGTWARRGRPRLAGLNLILSGFRQADPYSDTYVGKNRLARHIVVRAAHLRVCLDLVGVLADLPAFVTPQAEGIEDHQTGIGTTGLFEVSFVTALSVIMRSESCSIRSKRKV